MNNKFTELCCVVLCFFVLCDGRKFEISNSFMRRVTTKKHQEEKANRIYVRLPFFRFVRC